LKFIKHIHKLSGHVGITKTHDNIYKYFKINNIKSKIVEVCKSCKV